MKNLFFIITLLSSVYSFGQLPVDFPDKWRNKVICGEAETKTKSGSMYGTSFLNFPFRLTVSDDGISAEYNLREKFGEDEWGRTQTVSEFIEQSREPVYDTYGVLYAHVIYYKVPNVGRNSMGEVSSKHSIFQISLQKYLDQSMPSILTVKLFSGAYESTSISSNNVKFNICETLLSKEERIKIVNQKKEADNITLDKINELLASNVIENAANEYSKLNFQNSETKALIQQKLNEKYTSEILNLDSTAIKKYISANKKNLISINPGKYKLSFDKTGNSSIKEFPNYSDVPKKLFGTFEVSLKSQAEIILELKDSILVSSIYSSSWTKSLYKDKNDNFYYKTKTGLPVATISNNPSVDKKLVRINKVYKREKYANGILIDTQEFKTEKTVGILKKDQ
jgi:hypothetical protein